MIVASTGRTGAAGSAVDRASEVLGDLARRDAPLAPLTTYRVGGTAALLVNPRTDDDLVRIVEARRASGLPVVVIGRGSNLLVADEGFTGIAISTSDLPAEIGFDVQPDATVLVTAGGGVPLPVLARRTVAAGLTGFEWAVGVPGSVGGAVRMNAGGHGADMTTSLVDVDLLDLDADPADGPVLRRGVPAAELGLRFRASDLDDRHLVVRVRLMLRHGDRARGEAELAGIVRWRREHQPGGQNCGSVFVNPVPGELTAAGLVDGAGLRSWAVGTAHVSDKHANFVQAEPGAAAADVRAVVAGVRRQVAERWGVVLRSEVRLVGFAADPPTHVVDEHPAPRRDGDACGDRGPMP